MHELSIPKERLGRVSVQRMWKAEPRELTLIPGSMLKEGVLKPGEYAPDLFGTGATLKTLTSGHVSLIAGGSEFSIHKVGV